MNNEPIKIYFAGSIRGGREYAKLYSNIITELQNYGEVLTEHVGSSNVFKEEQHKTDEDIYNTDMNWLKESHVIVADVSITSMGVGYELGYASSINKKVLCLLNENSSHHLSAMINGDKTFKICKYKSIEDIKEELNIFFSSENLKQL